MLSFTGVGVNCPKNSLIVSVFGCQIGFGTFLLKYLLKNNPALRPGNTKQISLNRVKWF